MAFGQNRPLEFIRRHSADRYDRLIPFIPHVLNSEGYPNLDAEMEEWCRHWSVGNKDFQSEKSVYCIDRFNALKKEVIKRGYDPEKLQCWSSYVAEMNADHGY